MKIKNKEQIFIWISGVLFLLLFAHASSPLFPWSAGWDSAFFRWVGAGMTRGYLPYRDFFDMKGPWLFFIQYIGELLWYGRMGIFIMECINFGVVLWLCQKIYTKYYEGKGIIRSLFVILPLYLVLASTLEGGNITEEWSLPFIFLSLYLALQFILEGKEEHNPRYAFVYGICFGILALIRITNSVMICAIVGTITIFLMINRKWKNLLWNMLAFVLGVVAAFVAPLLYYGYHGEAGSMLYCTFVFGFIYGTEDYAIGTGALFLLTFLFTAAVFLIVRQKNKRLILLVLLNILGMAVTLGLGTSTLHDYILITPGMMLGVWEFSKAWKNGQTGIGKKLLLTVLLVLCFIYPSYKAMRAGKDILRQATDKTTYTHVMETLDCIPEEERESVWGYAVPMRWYVLADIMPYNKYCGWQEHYMKLTPQIEVEISEMLENEPPIWIVTKTSNVLENEMVKKNLAEDYSVYMENSDFRLYKRNGHE